MTIIEVIAVVLGLINVGLIIRRSIWNYPFGIAMVSLYAYIFFGAKLYSDMLLQFFFLVIQFYGWWNWARAGRVHGGIQASLLTNTGRIVAVVVAVLLSLVIGTLMKNYTDAAAPYADATIAGMSVLAQVLMSIRRIENWVFWILVDLMAVGLFASRGLHLTAGLYAVFLIMAVMGLLSWWRQGRAAS